MKVLLRLLLRVLFRFRADHVKALSAPGPVLLIPNHASWIDWLFLGVCLENDWRFVTSLDMVQRGHRWMRPIIDNRRTFPVDNLSPFAVRRMAEYLQKGGRLVLFAEGRLSRTGALMKLFDGTGFLLHKTGAKVITAYLRGTHRLPFSPNRDRKRWFPRVSVHFSGVLTPPKVEHLSTAKARTLLTNWLRDRLVEQRFATEMAFGPATVPEAILASARRAPKQVALEDVNGRLTYRRMLVGADLLARQWRQLLGGASRLGNAAASGPGAVTAKDSDVEVPLTRPAGSRSPTGGEGRGEGARFMERETRSLRHDASERVGVLLPNVNGMPVTLLSLWLAGKVPAVLNYSLGVATMLACGQLAGLRHIITSRAFLERAKLDLDPFTEAGLQLIYLEDVRQRITGLAKLTVLARLALTPRSALRTPHSANDPAVILFTSGSEGTPKGVELTHANLLANVRQVLAVTDLRDTDRMFNALPLFHSFGLTFGTLAPLIRGFFVFLYPSPLHYRVVPTVFYDRDCTILLGTNTFLNGYARKAHVFDFRSLRYLFAGAEKIQDATAATWAQRFGVRVLEGYGATECSPCISVCTPLAPKQGSAGRFLPGIEWKLDPVEGVTETQPAEGRMQYESRSLPPSASRVGRLLVRGPNVMRGYLNAEADAKFKALGGWYDTGDIARVDEEGFVHILGRLKRFAKVSGEMVSLTAVEDALAGAFPQYGLRCQVAVISRPDPGKGEGLVAVTNEPKLQLEEVRAALRAKGLPNLCVPREVKYLREIPKLGTGKVNHRELQALLA